MESNKFVTSGRGESKAISNSLEDYVEAAYCIIKKNGHAHAKEIADYLSVKMPSVTVALRQLSKNGYIHYTRHQPVELTATGLALAKLVLGRHQVLVRFFSELLGLSAEQSDLVACRVEHLVDERIVRRIALFSTALLTRSDSRCLLTYLTEAMAYDDAKNGGEIFTLTQLESGQEAEIFAISRNMTAPEKIARLGMVCGKKIKTEGLSLDKKLVRVEIANERLVLAIEDAENIWVKVNLPVEN